MFKREIRGPIAALVLLSLGGFLIHFRIHPPQESAFNWLPVAFAVLNVLILPFLFNSARTVAWACLLNAVTVLVGTATMAYVSITEWDPSLTPVTPLTILFKSTLADIVLLAAKLPVAHVILRHFRPLPRPDEPGAAP